MEFEMYRESFTSGVWIAIGALVLAFLTLLTLPARAQQREVPADRQQMQLSFAPIVKKAAPAVVNVYTKRTIRQSANPFANDPLFRRFFGDLGSFGAPRERVQSSLGSGVIVGANGVIVTNNHVIAGGEEFIVALADQREFPAKVILTDERTDLAVLRIDPKGEKLPTLSFGDSDRVEVGDLVLALGNPFGVGQTVTSGIISAVARTHVGVSDYQFFLQTDAAINPGNSGGALVTTDGRLIGVNTAIYSQSGGSIGIGFAIPSNMVRQIVSAAVNGGEVKRPWFGASGQTVTSNIAAAMNLDRPGGVVLQEVYPSSPAASAGLQSGDVIRKIDGIEVLDPSALRYRVVLHPVGSKASVDYIRKGRPAQTTVTLVAAPETPPRDLTRLKGAHPLAGAQVGNLSPALADELRLDIMKGVVVTDVAQGSAAARIGLQAGDVILSINGREMASADKLSAYLEAGGHEWGIKIRRGDQTFSVTIRG
jgi:serine protease Do